MSTLSVTDTSNSPGSTTNGGRFAAGYGGRDQLIRFVTISIDRKLARCRRSLRCQRIVDSTCIKILNDRRSSNRGHSIEVAWTLPFQTKVVTDPLLLTVTDVPSTSLEVMVESLLILYAASKPPLAPVSVAPDRP